MVVTMLDYCNAEDFKNREIHMRLVLKFLLVASACMVGGCAMSIGSISGNENSLRLESGNFTVEKRVGASSTTMYVLGLPLGGSVSANDVAAELSKSADLYGKPKSLTNYAVDREVR